MTALPKSPLGEATTYARNQWDALTVYVRDGDLAIDNNTAERAREAYAIGRKNWLFFGSDRGGQGPRDPGRAAATCQQFGVNPLGLDQRHLNPTAHHPRRSTRPSPAGTTRRNKPPDPPARRTRTCPQP